MLCLKKCSGLWVWSAFYSLEGLSYQEEAVCTSTAFVKFLSSDPVVPVHFFPSAYYIFNYAVRILESTNS